MADLHFGDIDSRRNDWSGETAKSIAARRPKHATERQYDHDEDRPGHDAGRLGRARERVPKLEDDERAEKAALECSDAALDGDEHGLTRRGPVQQTARR